MNEFTDEILAVCVLLGIEPKPEFAEICEHMGHALEVRDAQIAKQEAELSRLRVEHQNSCVRIVEAERLAESARQARMTHDEYVQRVEVEHNRLRLKIELLIKEHHDDDERGRDMGSVPNAELRRVLG